MCRFLEFLFRLAAVLVVHPTAPVCAGCWRTCGQADVYCATCGSTKIHWLAA